MLIVGTCSRYYRTRLKEADGKSEPTQFWNHHKKHLAEDQVFPVHQHKMQIHYWSLACSILLVCLTLVKESLSFLFRGHLGPPKKGSMTQAAIVAMMRAVSGSLRVVFFSSKKKKDVWRLAVEPQHLYENTPAGWADNFKDKKYVWLQYWIYFVFTAAPWDHISPPGGRFSSDKWLHRDEIARNEHTPNPI